MRIYFKIGGLFLALLLSAQSVSAVTATFSIDRAYLRQIDDNTYRLRLAVSWSATPLLMSDLGYTLPYEIAPKFDYFTTSLVGSNQCNATEPYREGWNYIVEPGRWYYGDFR